MTLPAFRHALSTFQRRPQAPITLPDALAELGGTDTGHDPITERHHATMRGRMLLARAVVRQRDEMRDFETEEVK